MKNNNKSGRTSRMYFRTVILYNWRSFKYLLKVGVELERTIDQLFKSNLTFCVVCFYSSLGNFFK
jgi:hypothetical protein